MNTKTFLRLGVLWAAVASVTETFEPEYPNAQFLSAARWLQSHKDEAGLVIVDVRIDKYFDGKLIPGAIRMPWRQFRYSDTPGDLLLPDFGRAVPGRVFGRSGKSGDRVNGFWISSTNPVQIR